MKSACWLQGAVFSLFGFLGGGPPRLFWLVCERLTVLFGFLGGGPPWLFWLVCEQLTVMHG